MSQNIIHMGKNLKHYFSLGLGNIKVNNESKKKWLFEAGILISYQLLTDFWPSFSRNRGTPDQIHKWPQGFLYNILLFNGLDCCTCNHSGICLGCK